MEDSSAELFLSAASAWEIAIKSASGKLRLPTQPDLYVPATAEALRTTALPVTFAHALRVARLPRHHGDPFDRLIVAQAQVEGLSSVTADPKLSTYDVELIQA